MFSLFFSFNEESSWIIPHSVFFQLPIPTLLFPLLLMLPHIHIFCSTLHNSFSMYSEMNCSHPPSLIIYEENFYSRRHLWGPWTPPPSPNLLPLYSISPFLSAGYNKTELREEKRNVSFWFKKVLGCGWETPKKLLVNCKKDVGSGGVHSYIFHLISEAQRPLGPLLIIGCIRYWNCISSLDGFFFVFVRMCFFGTGFFSSLIDIFVF